VSGESFERTTSTTQRPPLVSFEQSPSSKLLVDVRKQRRSVEPDLEAGRISKGRDDSSVPLVDRSLGERDLGST
jgi:hypothetical protein